MRFITRSSIPAFVICLVAVAGTARPASAQTGWSVSTDGELTAALAGAFNNNVANPSLLNTITLAGNISGSSQWIVNANVNIVGNGYTINMNNADRAFFVAGGTVGIANLTIANGNATGGTGGLGAGGGAGLGGGINGSAYGTDLFLGANVAIDVSAGQNVSAARVISSIPTCRPTPATRMPRGAS